MTSLYDEIPEFYFLQRDSILRLREMIIMLYLDCDTKDSDLEDLSRRWIECYSH